MVIDELLEIGGVRHTSPPPPQPPPPPPPHTSPLPSPHKHTHTHSHTVMNTAAALAAGSIVFRDADPPYAKRLLEHAQQLYSFGERCPGDYIVNGARRSSVVSRHMRLID